MKIINGEYKLTVSKISKFPVNSFRMKVMFPDQKRVEHCPWFEHADGHCMIRVMNSSNLTDFEWWILKCETERSKTYKILHKKFSKVAGVRDNRIIPSFPPERYWRKPTDLTCEKSLRRSEPSDIRVEKCDTRKKLPQRIVKRVSLARLKEEHIQRRTEKQIKKEHDKLMETINKHISRREKEGTRPLGNHVKQMERTVTGTCSNTFTGVRTSDDKPKQSDKRERQPKNKSAELEYYGKQRKVLNKKHDNYKNQTAEVTKPTGGEADTPTGEHNSSGNISQTSVSTRDDDADKSQKNSKESEICKARELPAKKHTFSADLKGFLDSHAMQTGSSKYKKLESDHKRCGVMRKPQTQRDADRSVEQQKRKIRKNHTFDNGFLKLDNNTREKDIDLKQLQEDGVFLFQNTEGNPTDLKLLSKPIRGRCVVAWTKLREKITIQKCKSELESWVGQVINTKLTDGRRNLQVKEWPEPNFSSTLIQIYIWQNQEIAKKCPKKCYKIKNL